MKKEEKRRVIAILESEKSQKENNLQYSAKLSKIYSEKVEYLTKDVTAIGKQVAKLKKQINDEDKK